MANKIRDLMTPNPVTLRSTSSIIEAATLMRDDNIGDVVVMQENDEVCGIVTDRDIVVRAVTRGGSMGDIRLGDICSRDLVTIGPDDSVDDAVHRMRDRAIRRLLVVEGKRPVGVVSIGDLAVHIDRKSALGDISAAPANK